MRAFIVESGKAAIRDVPQPKAASGEALIQVHLAGICGTDLEIVRGYGSFSGILGHEFIGVVTEGPAELLGKRVVGEINCVCGRCDMCASGLSNHCRRRTVMGIQGRPGAFAEFVTLPERNCHVVPDGVSDVEAVFAEPLAAAYQVMRQVKFEPRMNVAVLGTGRLGLLLAQVLAPTGSKLICVGRNPGTIGFLDRKGIRTASIQEFSGWGECDVVVDCTGNPEGLQLALRMVRPRGTVVLKTTCEAKTGGNLTPLVVNEVTLLGSRCGPFNEALAALARKQIDVQSMVSRQVPLSEGLAALEQANDPQNTKILLNCRA
jgi:threonine dehydrogenase-like Zn-dependent dehydrogenase